MKIQRDGTVEVDIENAPAASELLKLHPTLEGSSPIVDDVVSESKKLIPRLKIAILVVGTRGDVQPFLAIARRLQACLKYFTSFHYWHFILLSLCFTSAYTFELLIWPSPNCGCILILEMRVSVQIICFTGFC